MKQRSSSRKPFVMRDARVDGDGLNDEFVGRSWDAIRRASYEGLQLSRERQRGGVSLLAPAAGQAGMAPCCKLMHTRRTFALLSLCTPCFVNTGCTSGSEGSGNVSPGAPTTAPTTTAPESQATTS